jgi:hypothetical protein
MSWLPNPIACDVCGVVKQPSNHWYYAEIVPEYFWIHPWGPEADKRDKPYGHLCGQVCATRKLNEWMNAAAPPSTADKRTTDSNPQTTSIQKQREEN